MKKFKICIIALMYFLVPVSLCAMYEGDDFFFNEVTPTKKPLLQQNKIHTAISVNQHLENREKEVEIYRCYLPNFLSCLNNIYLFLKKKNNTVNIYLLPSGVMWHIAGFLGSPDILRLSGTCTKFRKIFNENYWTTYLSKIPKYLSFLVLNSSLSPISNRKAFFSHLWYSEGNMYLAAKLGHPEALMLQQYGIHGACIGKNQYLCPSGVIKYISNKTDNEKTDKLKEAESNKNKLDMKKIKKGQEHIMKFDLCWPHYPMIF